MNEHTSDSNAEYLKRHPDAEPDPDRANTAAYARKQADELIQIAKQQGQQDLISALESEAARRETPATAEYDDEKKRLEHTKENITKFMLKITSGDSEPGPSWSQRHINYKILDIEPEQPKEDPRIRSRRFEKTLFEVKRYISADNDPVNEGYIPCFAIRDSQLDIDYDTSLEKPLGNALDHPNSESTLSLVDELPRVIPPRDVNKFDWGSEDNELAGLRLGQDYLGAWKIRIFETPYDMQLIQANFYHLYTRADDARDDYHTDHERVYLIAPMPDKFTDPTKRIGMSAWKDRKLDQYRSKT